MWYKGKMKKFWNFLFCEESAGFCPTWMDTSFKCCSFPQGGSCVFQITVLFPHVPRGRCLELNFKLGTKGRAFGEGVLARRGAVPADIPLHLRALSQLGAAGHAAGEGGEST